MIRTVVFDMDDTLYDEVDYCRSGFKACGDWLCGQFGADAEAMYAAMWGEFESGDRRRVFNAALDKGKNEYDNELIGEMVRVYREHEPTIELPIESREVLEELAGKYNMALLTDGFLPAQRLKVEALGIEGYFQCIVYTEELGREFWKPSPVGFEKIMSHFGAKADECVYIADNAKKDFIGPNALGFKTIQLKRANKVHLAEPEGENARPGLVIESIKDVLGLVGEL